MRLRKIWASFLVVSALCALTFTGSVQAETILKLDLGSTSEADIELVSGVLSTFRDTGAAFGDQSTDVEFLSFVDSIADISGGSFTLSDVALAGSPTDLGSLITQSTNGGNFEIFDAAGASILTGTLNAGVLIGPPSGAATSSATGSFLTATMGSFTGPNGSDLFSQLAPNSASISISLTNVIAAAGGKGFSIVQDGNGMDVLADFQADATANIAAISASGGNNLPEPSSMALAIFGLIGALNFRRR